MILKVDFYGAMQTPIKDVNSKIITVMIQLSLSAANKILTARESFYSGN